MIVTIVFIYPLFYFLSLDCTHVAFVNCLLKKLDDDDDDDDDSGPVVVLKPTYY